MSTPRTTSVRVPFGYPGRPNCTRCGSDARLVRWIDDGDGLGERLCPHCLQKRTYYVGIDPAHGDDQSVETVFERMPDGSLRLIDKGRVIEGEIVK